MRRWQHTRLAGFRRDERGTTMVEFAICISLFLLIFFAVLDFGRLAYNWVMAEKAMERAARIAAVRPAVCAGVPDRITRVDPFDTTFPTGTLCRSTPGLCVQTNPAPCTLATADGTSPASLAVAGEIWSAIRPMLPDNASAANVMLQYRSDPQLGFLGGPYTPLITAELVGNVGPFGASEDFRFSFVTPLSALAAAAGASNTSGVPAEGGTIPFPDVAVTIPAEDMNFGGGG